MTHLIRRFTQARPIVRDGSPQPEGEIEDFFGHRVFVVLGEPGLGKTTSFEYAAEQEADSEFVRVGEFLSMIKLEHLQGETLYLDGLDEHRSRANGVDIMDAIVGRLKELGCPKVRISCRTAEWHGGKDLDALSAVSDGTPIVQLDLQPLTQEDILSLTKDSKDFVDGAREHGLDEFLRNPQDFFLLHKFYLEKNSWPDNRSELMEGACKALLKEPNKQHSKTVDDLVGDRDLARASDYLASILMLSNASGISSERAEADKAFPAIHEFDGNLNAMKAATGRHVFKSAENRRIEPKHRKIAEYLAARYLAARVREGLPLRRVMALMTGIDGGTPPDLRGVYAWLVTMLSGMADHVLVHDPYGAVIYGDAHAWTPNTKRSAVKALQKLAEKDPWFRGQDWSRTALGGLADPTLAEDFKTILLEDDCKSHFMSTILDALAGGSRLPELGDVLLDFVRNLDKPDHLRSSAVDAFVTACPDRQTDLVTLLEGVHAGEILDEDQYLRGALLRHLYPVVIGPNQVAKYLVPPSGGVIGWYHMFVRYTIFERTPKEGLRALAQSFQARDSRFEQDDEYDATSFISKLIRHLLEEFGESASVSEISSWLYMGIDQYESSLIRGDETKAISDFLANHDQIFADLFFEFLDERWSDEMNWHQIWWRFREFVNHVPPPHGFPRALLSQLEKEADTDRVEAMYELACVLVMNENPGLPSVTIEELGAVSAGKPEFEKALERASVCDVDDWRQKNATRTKRRLEERETRQSRNIESYTPQKAEIESAKALGILDHYARVWFNLFTDINHEASASDRLREEVGDELAKSVLIGFQNALHEPCFNTLEEIAKTDVESRAFYRGYLMLAAMDVLAMGGKEAVLKLPDDIIRLALAYDMANSVERRAEWLLWILTDKFDLAAQVLDEYWRIQLATNPERITNFYAFNGDEPRLPVVVEVLPGLLRDFPTAHPQLLRSMLLNAIRFCPYSELRPLVTNVLKKRFRDGTGQRTMWIATGFVTNQNDYLVPLKKQLRRHEREKWAARPILLGYLWKLGEDSKLLASTRQRKVAIEILGSVFRNVRVESSEGARFISDQDEPTAAEEIRSLIHAFAQDPSDDATMALAELEKNPSLSHWHTDVLYTIANQVRTAREANFTYADVSQVVSTLSNKEPANVADLRALVMDALKEIAGEIRHGNTDGYKSFWNVGAYGKATDIHVDENTARDRLLELLRPKLRHLDIVAEPEVRYAEEKRADIAIYCPGMKLPIEIKRDDHAKIWTSAEDQLKKQYSRDPASEGNGIYLAFWLDGKGMAKPPNGIQKPTSAEELMKALKAAISESSRGLIDVLVIDASVPEEKRADAAKSKPKKAKSRAPKTKRRRKK